MKKSKKLEQKEHISIIAIFFLIVLFTGIFTIGAGKVEKGIEKNIAGERQIE